jgi:uncharacterized protein YciI
MDIQSLLDSIPTPTDADMLERRKLARRYTVILLREGPASRADEEQNERIHREHLQHLTKLQIMGKLILNGPTLGEADDISGISIYAAEREEAIALASADPKVRAGYLIVQAIEWIGVASVAAINEAIERS